MSWRHPLYAISLVASVAACASVKVGYDYDPHADFSAYRTYEWMADRQEATGDRRVDNAGMDIRLRTAIGSQLRQKGYAMSADRHPDFYVAYYLGLKDLTPDTSSQYLSEGMAGHPFSHVADSRSKETSRSTSTKIEPNLTGLLLIDVIDAASNKLVWRGTADGSVDPGLTSEERNERVRAVVRHIFAHFPPK